MTASMAAILFTRSCWSTVSIFAVRRNLKVRKHSEQDCQGRACTKKRRGTFQADEKCPLQPDADTIQALPADVLLHIFGYLNPQAHRETLPLVCRQWHDVLQGPVSLWRHLELDFPSAMAMAADGSHLTPSKKFQVGIPSPASHGCQHGTTPRLES